MSDTKAALAALNAGGKRVRIHDAQIVVKLPSAIKTLVEEVAQANGVPTSVLIRWALADYFEKRGLSK